MQIINSVSLAARVKPVGRYKKLLTKRLLGIEGFIVKDGLLVPVPLFDPGTLPEDLKAKWEHAHLHAAAALEKARAKHQSETGGLIGFNEMLNVLVGFTDESEANALKLILQNVAWANIGDASGLQPSGTAGSFYISLHNADPAETGSQTANETAYTNYGRIAVARSSGGWTVAGTAPTQGTNAAAINFAQCGASGDTLTHAGLGTAATLAGHLVMGGALTASRTISNGTTPSFAIGDFAISLE